MLEDSKMDKKITNRSSQIQSHASGVDCRKNSDLTHRPASRYNKKREGPGVSKNDPSFKNVPVQRGKWQVEKRNRPRGSSSTDLGGAESTWLAEDEPQVGSVLKYGSKKQNMASLTNFSSGYNGGRQRRAPEPRTNFAQRFKGVHPHNNDLYLQAWCQFIVKEDGDYKMNLLDPDVQVKWEQIEEIVVRSAGKCECPICLGSPVAARVGRCGHVHCGPCALHLAAAAAAAAPPCPVCAAPLHVRLMKPARVLLWEPPGEHVSMRLVRRLRGSTQVEAVTAVAAEAGDAARPDKVPPLRSNYDAPFAKLLYINAHQVLDIIKRHRQELQDQILNEIDTTEIVFIEEALEMLKLQEEQINTPEVPKGTVENKNDDVPIVYEKQSLDNSKKIDWFDEEEGAACMEEIQAKSKDLSLNASESHVKTELNPDAPIFEIDAGPNKTLEFPLQESVSQEEPENEVDISEIDIENNSKYFYFYQAEDGQAVFLHRLNVRLLTASWGLLARAPSTLRARVLHRETLSLDAQSRKRLPYATHLPLHSPFDIVELDLQPPDVTPEAIEKHAEALEARARARVRLAREERQRERRARPPAPAVSFTEEDFPPSAPAAYPGLPSPSTSSSASSPSSSGGAGADHSVASSSSGLSFAKMASAGGTWRVRPNVVRAPTPPPPDTDELAPPPLLSLADAFTAAINAPKQKKGKKKGKQKLLLSLGMQRPAE